MPSSFFELSVATTGLFTTKAALNVVGHNIANAETPGYSRQVALIRARTPLNYQNGRGMVGTGSELYGIGQMRSFYLDTKFWTHTGSLGEYTAKSAQNRMLQSTFNENDETGFNKMMNDFFGLISGDWPIDAGNATARLATINSAEALVQQFNSTYSTLQKQQSDINQEIKGMVSTINNLGLQIQNLNKQIYVSELGGQTANDLRDARALVVDELAKYVNVEVREVELNKDLLTGECDRRFQVTINGYDFVNHYELNSLMCIERTAKNNFEDAEGLYDIYWSSGVKFNSEYSLASMSGELKGLLVTRDGNNKNNPTADIAATPPIATDPATGVRTLTLENWSRTDLPQSGNITIGNKVYAYDNFKYDELTGEMTIDIPPKSGEMTIGTTVYRYMNLKIVGNDITFDIAPTPSTDELRSKIKIGDMILSGGISLDTSSGTAQIRIANCTAATNINAITEGSSAKVGQSVDYKGLPYFMAKMNTFVRGIARSFNLGQDAYGNQLNGVVGHYNAYNQIEGDNTGYNFFAYDGCSNSRDEYLNYHLMTAGNFSVAKELLEDPSALAAALSPSADISDNTYLLMLSELKHNPHVFDEGEYGNYIESIIGELGVITNEALSFEQNYTDIVTNVDYQRLSVSSVSLNEEMAIMTYLQQIYNACAKLVETLNGIYDTTISMVR